MKYTTANADRVLKALVEGPAGQQIEADAEAERAAQCAKLHEEYESGQKKHQADLSRMQPQLDELGAKVQALKKQIEPLEQEWQKLSWRVADKRGAMVEHRDRYWRQLTGIADPRIAGYRREFEARLRATETMPRTWQTGPARSVFEQPPTANNMMEINRAGQYLLAAIDATARWAREGLQGEAVDRAYQEIMAKFPRIPMAKDDPGEIPGQVDAGPADYSTLRLP